MTTTSQDIPKTTHSVPEIKIFGPHECPNCGTAMKLFDRHGIDYTKIDLEAGDENHRYVTEDLGYLQAPVIVVELGRKTVHWGGHRMDMLMALVRLCTQGIVPEHEADDR
ncbi:glutaredoxin family protein [Streptomyces sp. NPDC052042]|uniref:glutaredoxin family protein n=1 Tax=Streptomyces sp. NPDC052042 TaxID=3365683 RepID=UPI0037CD2519